MPFRPTRRLGALLLAGALLTGLPACVFHAFTTTYTYEWDGRTWQIANLNSNVHNLTLYEVVDGKPEWRGFMETGGGPYSDFETAEIPDEPGHERQILTIIQQGRQVGDPVKETQRSIDHDFGQAIREIGE